MVNRHYYPHYYIGNDSKCEGGGAEQGDGGRGEGRGGEGEGEGGEREGRRGGRGGGREVKVVGTIKRESWHAASIPPVGNGRLTSR